MQQPNRPDFYRRNELDDMYNDRKKRRINPWGAFILLVIIVAGLVVFFVHGMKSDVLPLPASAKRISANTIQISFPYSESKSGEVWKMVGKEENKSLEVTNKGEIVVDIPLTNVGTPFYITKLGKRVIGGDRYKTNTTIQLGSKVYTITQIDVNSDGVSGNAILK